MDIILLFWRGVRATETIQEGSQGASGRRRGRLGAAERRRRGRCGSEESDKRQDGFLNQSNPLRLLTRGPLLFVPIVPIQFSHQPYPPHLHAFKLSYSALIVHPAAQSIPFPQDRDV